MKVLKFITHPYTLIISFLAVLISGEHVGGFYLLYLLLALPRGASYALVAVAGIGIILTSYNIYKRKYHQLAEPLLNILGALLLITSLFIFFYRDKEGYNDSTFHQWVPLFTILFFTLTAFCFLINNIRRMMTKRAIDHHLSL